MKITIQDFRCFHEPSPVVIRPINLLVGENSAGKTSFMAATRFLLELFRRGAQPSFNKEPYHLGSFEQIAHFRGGRFGRAKNFSFEVEDLVPSEPRTGRVRTISQENIKSDPSESYQLKVTFKDYKSQPILAEVRFKFGQFGFLALFDDKFSLTISTPSRPTYTLSDRFTDRAELAQVELSYVDFLLRDLRFIVRREEGATKTELEEFALTEGPSSFSKEFLAEVDHLSSVYRRVQMTLPREVYASAPVRSKPERTYNPADFVQSPDGGHIPFVLAQMRSFDPKKSQEIEKDLSAFGKASGLFDKVHVSQIGKAKSGPFQVVVTLPGRKSNIIDVGYGVSQALPIIADLLRMHGGMFLFQQPEVHLHPRAQAELGTFFARVAKQKKHTLFLETHSDYLVDRIRMEIRKGEIIRPQDVSVLYFARTDHDVEIHSMEFDKNGNLHGAPEGYRNFFLREELRSLGMEPN